MPGPAALDDPLADAIRRLREVATPAEIGILRQLAEGSSLRQVAANVGVTKARVHQIQQSAVARLARVTPVSEAWRTALRAGPQSEASLVATFGPRRRLSSADRAAVHVLLWASAGARLVRFMGQLYPGFWMQSDDNIGGRVWLFREQCPVADEDFGKVACATGLDPVLCRRLLRTDGHVVHNSNLRGWLRHPGEVRDGAELFLRRRGSSATSEEIAQAVGRPPAVVSNQMLRDGRFRRLPAHRAWVLAAWPDSYGQPSFVRTQDAIRAVLRDAGPLPAIQVLRRVQKVHPVSDTALRRWLRHEEFGRLPDGRVWFSADGAKPYVESSPVPVGQLRVGRDWLEFRIPVDADLLRGSSVRLPRAVAWHLGLRSAPRSVTLRAEDGREYTVSRRPGYVSISSLRKRAGELGLGLGDELVARVHLVEHVIILAAA